MFNPLQLLSQFSGQREALGRMFGPGGEGTSNLDKLAAMQSFIKGGDGDDEYRRMLMMQQQANQMPGQMAGAQAPIQQPSPYSQEDPRKMNPYGMPFRGNGGAFGPSRGIIGRGY